MLSKMIDKLRRITPEDSTGTGNERLVVTVQTVRLTPEVYAALERQLPPPTVTTDPTEAAIQVGVQIVLRRLRDGFVA